MSGSTIPYHLRQNKAIERNLFLDLLGRFNRFRNISSYQYIGMGGPFLEDFKVLHTQLGIKKMISVELDSHVHKRQVFNQPFRGIDFRHSSMGDFINQHDFDETPHVIWLDYTKPKQLLNQLNEFRSVIAKLKPYDILKISINANPETLGGDNREEDWRQKRLDRLAQRLGIYHPANAQSEDITSKRYPILLLRAIKNAVDSGMKGRLSNEKFLPLTTFVYKDTAHQMLTFTGTIVPKTNGDGTKIDTFLKITRLYKWKYSNLIWSPPKDISAPDLSVKERLHLESSLPEHILMSTSMDLQRALGFSVADDLKSSAKLLGNFAEYYRHLPWYSKVTI